MDYPRLHPVSVLARLILCSNSFFFSNITALEDKTQLQPMNFGCPETATTEICLGWEAGVP